ncbi:hypothetical protein [Salicola sp. Rm-C-2C1-2]|uniref:hypothetical protein n=1 Tax=Salicola sp. Rm-C-2C1-2 TaxID=3141321 RepID=UPI0032E4ECFB
MANIPSQEAILAFIRDILDAGPADKKRKEYEELRRQSDKQLATTQDYLDEITATLALDPTAQRHALSNYDAFYSVNNFLERHIWVSSASQKHVLWLMATHVYAPGLGRHLAFWDSAQRTDPGMPGGRFWYLPCVVQEDDDQLTMPITQVMDWLLDLLSCSLDKLAQTLSSSNTIPGREKDAVADTNSIRKTLWNWYNVSGTPGISKIQEFFNNQIHLNFSGTFDWNKGENTDEDFRRALDFCIQKELTPQSLRREIPITEAKAAELLEGGQPSAEDKRHFCSLLAQRYHTPSVKTIRKRLLYARAFQATYWKLVKAIEVPERNARLANPELNQAIQVVSLFQTVYNLTVDSCSQTNDENEERRLFGESLERRFPLEACTSLLAINPSDGHLELLANQLNKKLMELDEAHSIEDEALFNLSKERFEGVWKRKLEFLQACDDDLEESRWLNNAPSDAELYRRIDRSRNWQALNSVVGSDTISLAVRRAAAWRTLEIAESEVKRAYALVSLLGQLLNDPDKRYRSVDTEKMADSLLNRLRQLDSAGGLDPLVMQLEAKHELSKNRIKESRKKLGEAHHYLRKQGFGDLRGEVARDALAVFASGRHPWFNLEACDQYILSMVYYGGLERPLPSIPTTEQVVELAREYFWNKLYQPYESYQDLRSN